VSGSVDASRLPKANPRPPEKRSREAPSVRANPVSTGMHRSEGRFPTTKQAEDRRASRSETPQAPHRGPCFLSIQRTAVLSVGRLGLFIVELTMFYASRPIGLKNHPTAGRRLQRIGACTFHRRVFSSKRRATSTAKAIRGRFRHHENSSFRRYNHQAPHVIEIRAHWANDLIEHPIPEPDVSQPADRRKSIRSTRKKRKTPAVHSAPAKRSATSSSPGLIPRASGADVR